MAGFSVTFSDIKIQVIGTPTVVVDADGVERFNILEEHPLTGESLRKAMKLLESWNPAIENRLITEFEVELDGLAKFNSVTWDDRTEKIKLVYGRLEKIID